jgi:hypothetical protein
MTDADKLPCRLISSASSDASNDHSIINHDIDYFIPLTNSG